MKDQPTKATLEWVTTTVPSKITPKHFKQPWNKKYDNVRAKNDLHCLLSIFNNPFRFHGAYTDKAAYDADAAISSQYRHAMSTKQRVSASLSHVRQSLWGYKHALETDWVPIVYRNETLRVVLHDQAKSIHHTCYHTIPYISVHPISKCDNFRVPIGSRKWN